MFNIAIKIPEKEGFRAMPLPVKARKDGFFF